MASLLLKDSIIKSFQALAFVPPNRGTEAFQELMGSLDDKPDELLSDFLSYFEAAWIGVVQRGRRRRPHFAISLWNVNSRVDIFPEQTTPLKDGIIRLIIELYLIYLEMTLSNKRRSPKHGGFYVTSGYLADKECGIGVS